MRDRSSSVFFAVKEEVAEKLHGMALKAVKSSAENL